MNTIVNEKNRELLLKVLKLSNLTKAQCSELLGKHQKSLDTYIYKYSDISFPPSFAYFFLNSIASSLISFYDRSKKISKYEYFKSHNPTEEFYRILKKCESLEITEKLILPCLEHHCMLLIKLSNSQSIHDIYYFEDEYIDITLPGIREAMEEYEDYAESFSEVPMWLDTSKGTITNPEYLNHPAYVEMDRDMRNEKLIDSIKNFYPYVEKLRKHYMENFVAPHETFKLPVLNSNEKILFSKDFIKRNLNIKKYDDLVLMNVDEDNMQGTFNKNDIALIVKFKNNISPKKYEDGIYALNINEKISIRRLQFLKLPKRTLVTIISDNKNYSDQNVALEDLSIFGEVVWKCNNFKDIKFEKYIDDTPDLFSEEKIITNKLLEKETA